MDDCNTPDCAEALKELDLYLDAELTATAHDAVHQHLDQCPDCYSAFDFHAELKLVIQRKCQETELPPDLLAKIERCFDTDFNGDGVIG